jgi:hypothetical protein
MLTFGTAATGQGCVMRDGTQYVKRLLTGLPYPPMPGDLAVRLQTVIAVEAKVRAG